MEVERDIVAGEMARLDADVDAVVIAGKVHRRVRRQSQTYMTGEVVVERTLYKDVFVDGCCATVRFSTWQSATASRLEFGRERSSFSSRHGTRLAHTRALSNVHRIGRGLLDEADESADGSSSGSMGLRLVVICVSACAGS